MTHQVSKDDLVEALYDIFQEHRATKYNKNDPFLRRQWDTVDGLPFVLNSVTALGLTTTLTAVASQFLDTDFVNRNVKNITDEAVDQLTGSSSKNFSINLDNDEVINLKAGKTELKQTIQSDFRERLIKNKAEDHGTPKPLTKDEMSHQLEVIDVMTTAMSVSVTEKSNLSNKDDSLKVSKGDAADNRVQVDNSGVIKKASDEATKFGMYHTTMVVEDGTQINHNPVDSPLEPISMIALSVALSYIALAKVFKRLPNAGKLIQRERNVNELTSDNNYADNLASHVNKMRELASKDECLSYISDHIFTGNHLDDFDKLLTFVTNLPENRLKSSVVNKCRQESNDEYKRRIEPLSRDVVKMMIAYDNAQRPKVKKELKQMAVHSLGVADLLIDKYNADNVKFENDHPELFQMILKSGALTSNPDGFIEKATNVWKGFSAKIGMSNRDILVKSRLAIRFKELTIGLDGHGKSTDETRKQLYSVLGKFVQNEMNSPSISGEEKNKLKLLSNAVTGVSNYIGRPARRPSNTL